MFKSLASKIKLVVGVTFCEAVATVDGCTEQLQDILESIGVVEIDFTQFL